MAAFAWMTNVTEGPWGWRCPEAADLRPAGYTGDVHHQRADIFLLRFTGRIEVWVVAAETCGQPLTRDRIRIGKNDARQITRRGQPKSFLARLLVVHTVDTSGSKQFGRNPQASKSGKMLRSERRRCRGPKIKKPRPGTLRE